ncbi:unnamed protein product [Musa acuminata subsp. burmannicoides]
MQIKGTRLAPVMNPMHRKQATVAEYSDRRVGRRLQPQLVLRVLRAQDGLWARLERGVVRLHDVEDRPVLRSSRPGRRRDDFGEIAASTRWLVFSSRWGRRRDNRWCL